MAITFSCPTCHKTIKTGEESAGKTGRCPHCQSTFTIPGVPQQTPAADPLGDLGNIPLEQPGPPPGHMAGPGPGGVSGNPYAASKAPLQHGVRMGRDHRGSTVMVLGIISLVCSVLGFFFFCCCPWLPFMPVLAIGLGVTAILMGQSDLKAMSAGQMAPDGEGQTRAGWIMGICGVVLGGLMMVGWVILMVLGLVGQFAQMQ